MNLEDTIYALSTPHGRGAIAVVRVSGARCAAVLEALGVSPPAVRVATLRQLHCPQTKRVLDEAIVLRFAAPHSYTGEDMLELQLHNGRAVIDGILAALEAMAGLRVAEAGEFSRRAVLNGRLDMTQAEGIADLIDAETQSQHAQAMRQMQGALGVLYEGWRGRIETALAHLEADIEFADEDLPGGLGQAAVSALHDLPDEIAAHLADGRGERLREGLSVVIIGPPNAGKSSLLNHLAGRDAAIVSARAGTTRDVVEVSMTLAGAPIVLADTAGLRDAGDSLEREGVARARARADTADLRIVLEAYDARLADSTLSLDANDIHLINKSDLVDMKDSPPTTAHPISIQTGAGLAGFEAELEQRIATIFAEQETPRLTRARHRDALTEALNALHRALEGDARGLELVAEDLRLAARSLGRITGAVDVEGLLDIVFRDFCIGK